MATKYKSKKKQRADKYQATTDKLLKLLEQGTKPWIKPWSATPYQNLISQNKYSGINPVLCSIDMLVNDWEHPFFLTFNQAKDKGWVIKKGSKATNILYAGSYEKKVENEEGLEAS